MRVGPGVVGEAAETVVSNWLARSGWRILGRNVRVGRNELDIVAVDPGPPCRLVAVEVRWRRRPDHGRPEETVDRRKLLRLRVALAAIAAAGRLPDGARLPPCVAAVDVVGVMPEGGRARLVHIRDVTLD